MAWPHALEVRTVEEVGGNRVAEWFNTFPRVKRVDIIGVSHVSTFLLCEQADTTSVERDASCSGNLVQLIRWARDVFQPTTEGIFLGRKHAERGQ